MAGPLSYLELSEQIKQNRTQVWPPSWLEYEQPGATVFEYSSPYNLLGFFSGREPNYLNVNVHPLAKDDAPRTLRHEAEHRQHNLFANEDFAARRWDRVPEDVVKANEYDIRARSYKEFLADLAELRHYDAPRYMRILKRTQQINPEFFANLEKDQFPIFNVQGASYQKMTPPKDFSVLSLENLLDLLNPRGIRQGRRAPNWMLGNQK